MSDNRKEIIELVRALIDSTATYVAPRIDNDKNKFAYIRAMSRCYTICGSMQNADDLAATKFELLKVLHDFTTKCPKRRFEFFSNTRKYYMLGIEHSLDIVDSLTKRFDGHAPHSDVIFPRSILEVFGYEGPNKESGTF